MECCDLQDVKCCTFLWIDY